MKAKKIIGLILALVMCLGIMTPMTAFADGATANDNVVYFEDFENYIATYGGVDRTGKDVNIAKANGWWSNKDNDKNGVYDVTVGKALDGSDNIALNHDSGSGTQLIDFRLKYGLTKDLSGGFVLSFRVYPVQLGTLYVACNDHIDETDRTDAGTGRTDTDFKFEKGGLKFGGKQTAFTLATNTWSTIEITYHYNEAANGINQISAKINGEDVYYEENGERITVATLPATHVNPNFFRVGITGGKYISIDDWKISYPVEETPAATAKTEFVGYQTSAAANDKFNLRLVGIMNDTDISQYAKVGFKVKATYGTTEMNKTQDITTVYESITATSGSNYTEYTAEALGGSYIFALNCLNVPANAGAITFEVTTYYQLEGSEVVEEATVTFTVDPATDIPKVDAK